MTDEELQAVRNANEQRRRIKNASTSGTWFGARAAAHYGEEADERGYAFGAGMMAFGRVTPSPDRSASADTIFICTAHNDPVEDVVDSLLNEIERLKSLCHDPEEWPMASPEQEELAAEAADELRRQELEHREQSLLKVTREEIDRLKKRLNARDQKIEANAELAREIYQLAQNSLDRLKENLPDQRTNNP